jgi:hypothetical protein
MCPLNTITNCAEPSYTLEHNQLTSAPAWAQHIGTQCSMGFCFWIGTPT